MMKGIRRIVMYAANETAASHYYPSAAGAPLDHGERLSIQLNLADTLVTVEGAIEDPTDSAGLTVTWVNISEAGYKMSANASGAASFNATGTTFSEIVDFGRYGPTPVRAWRVKSVPPDGSNSLRATALIRG
jgi:hypothetical protein